MRDVEHLPTPGSIVQFTLAPQGSYINTDERYLVEWSGDMRSNMRFVRVDPLGVRDHRTSRASSTYEDPRDLTRAMRSGRAAWHYCDAWRY